jgi:hypothetical protein
MDDLSLKQLETLIWSVSKRPEEEIILHSETVNLLIKKVAAKSASMKARGISFAVEAIANLHQKVGGEGNSEEVFKRLERVILVKIDEFIPHYLVKCLASFSQA